MKNRNSYFLPALAIVALVAFLAVFTEAKAECAPFGLPMTADRGAAIQHFETQDSWTIGDIEHQEDGAVVHYYEKWYEAEQITQVVALWFHDGMLSNVLITFLTDHKPGAREMLKLYKLAPDSEADNCDGLIKQLVYKKKFPAFVSTRPNGSGQLYALEVDGERLFLTIWYGSAAVILAEASKLET